jgi:hypothetical protein
MPGNSEENHANPLAHVFLRVKRPQPAISEIVFFLWREVPVHHRSKMWRLCLDTLDVLGPNK